MHDHLLHITIPVGDDQARDLQRSGPLPWATRIPTVGESVVLEVGKDVEYDVTKVMWYERGGAWIWLAPNPRTAGVAAKIDYPTYGFQDFGLRDR